MKNIKINKTNDTNKPIRGKRSLMSMYDDVNVNAELLQYLIDEYDCDWSDD